VHFDVLITVVLIHTIGFLLVISSFGKIRHYNTFHENLINAFKVPAPFGQALTILLITVELMLAVLLFLGKPQLIILSLHFSTLLFTLFTLIITQKLLSHQKVVCNCFGVNKENLTFLDVVRNVIIIAFCLISSTNYSSEEISLVGYIISSFMMINLILILLNFKSLTKILLYSGK